ncbi:D-alanine--D-alanine ligase [Bordetella ansorpii]|uniref:D-alanine--D-alanine ligase n=1 Tax=Bordetella ansorpii TaxID=288768 RepID=A0A157SVN1_9BORD|nr:non-ribosomal peptide synthetase [Bordetella ansorpii]SAI74507.1 D-alanine--D-alanine ligase [Bordetella ansorpii]
MDRLAAERLMHRFANATPEQRAQFYQRMRDEGISPAQLPLIPRPIQGGPQGLSHAQARLWFIWNLDRLGNAYHIVRALRLSGPLDGQALQSALSELAARHESLRTVFRAGEGGEGEAVVLPSAPPELARWDLRGQEDALAQARGLAQQVADTPFDLCQGPLLRAGLVRLDEQDYVLVLAMHHIVSDAWSMGVLVEELVARYMAHAAPGTARQWPALPVQYADYAAWQRNWLDAGERERQLAYWREALAWEEGVPPTVRLSADHPRRADGRYRAANETVTLDAPLARSLREVAQAHEASLFMVLLAGFMALLHRYTGQDTLRLGVPIANRHRRETEGLIGLFVNTQLLQARVDGRTTLAGVLARVRAAALGAQAHQDLPYEQLVESLRQARGSHPGALFEVMYNHLQSAPSDQRRRVGSLDIAEYPLEGRSAQCELVLTTTEDGTGAIRAVLTYARELFEAPRMRRLGGHYLEMLRALARDAGQAVADVVLLAPDEDAELRAWGEGAPREAEALPVHARVEAHAARKPDAVALVSGGRTLSYAELNRRANRVAHRLIALGVGPDVQVGVALPRSVAMVVALLGILKAGGAYVPLDPDYPAQRLADMARDADIALLLVDADTGTPAAGWTPVRRLRMADTGLEEAQDHAGHESNPGVPVHADHPIYVMYTSGSTGRPKGVVAVHRGVDRLVGGARYARLDETVRMLQFAPLAFDASTLEIWGTLCNGGTLVQAPAGPLGLADLAGVLRGQSVNTAWLTAALFNQLVTHQADALAGLGQLITGGEAMSAHHAALARQAMPHGELINGYGPTETTTFAACRRVDDLDLARGAVPVGTPIGCTRCVLLDQTLQPVPAGVAAELYIGADGLARGYLGQAGMTASRFVADPCGPPGARLYRTGDLARWRHDGQLEYLGRLDGQVKLHGHRIEMGEVESALLRQPGVAQAAAAVRAGALVAYVVAGGDARPDTAALRRALREALPAYLVPSAIGVLRAIPLTGNGKIDRAALPDIEDAAAARQAPQGETEMALADLWRDVLQAGPVGRDQTFFSVGGHSLAAMRLQARVRERFGVDLPLRLFFEQATVASLAGEIDAARGREQAGEQDELASMAALLAGLEN